MRYGIVDPASDPLTIAELAVEAEQAGWDGVFLADALAIEPPGFPAFPWFDTWVALAACAMRTRRIRLGSMLTAVPRHKPWELARQAGTLDHLSGGRAILAAGIGAAEHDGGFYKVGEPMDIQTRAERLDEALEIIAGLWTGHPVEFHGKHFQVDKMTMLPAAVQQPRIPIWVVGVWPKMKSMRRALRYDGVIPQRYKGTPASPPWTPEEVATLDKWMKEQDAEKKNFDICVGGSTATKEKRKAVKKAEAYSQAGATWWLESFYGMPNKSPVEYAELVRARIRQGPPKTD